MIFQIFKGIVLELEWCAIDMEIDVKQFMLIVAQQKVDAFVENFEENVIFVGSLNASRDRDLSLAFNGFQRKVIEYRLANCFVDFFNLFLRNKINAFRLVCTKARCKFKNASSHHFWLKTCAQHHVKVVNLFDWIQVNQETVPLLPSISSCCMP